MPRDDVPFDIKALCTKRPAESVLTVKDFQDQVEYFEFSGMATTPQVDLVGDIVEPDGAEFALPVKLLSKHDNTKPIGNVYWARITKDGIQYKARIPKVVEPGIVKDRVEEAIHEIKYRLVSNVSIGFQPIADAVEALKTGGLRFGKWLWLELSLAPIPANFGATIQAFKSLDAQLHSALTSNSEIVKSANRQQRGIAPASSVVRLATAPDVSGTTSIANETARFFYGDSPPTRSKGTAMPTIQESIASFEAKRAASDARVNELVTRSAEEGRTFDEQEQGEVDNLTKEVAAIDKHLVILRSRADAVKSGATSVGRDAGTDPDVAQKSRGGLQTVLAQDSVPPEMMFIRHVKCELLARMEGGGRTPLQIAKTFYPESTRLHNVFDAERKMGMPMQKALGLMRQKANVSALNTADAAGGGALAQYQLYAGDFVNWLRPQTIVGQFGQGGIPGLRRVPFRVSVASQTSGGAANWVGEGKAKPVTSFGFTRTNLERYKIAAIAVATEEQIRSSDPDADTTLRDALRDVIVEREDRDFIDPDFAGAAGVSPASVTYGATGSAASGTTNAASTTDMQTLLAPMLRSNLSPGGVVLIMSAVTALALSMARDSLGNLMFPGISVNGGRFAGLPVIVSQYADFGAGNSPATGGVIIAVNAPEIYFASDNGVEIAMSNQATIEMSTTPAGDSVTPTAGSTNYVNMFQTDSVAIRAELYVNWARRRPAAVQYLTGVAYNGLNS